MMMHIEDHSEDDYYEPRLSNESISSSLILPPMIRIESQPQPPRKSLSYDKLYPEPLSLTVLKLDGSSFGIEVMKTGTVGEVKRAVEAAFGHLPKKGPGKISWVHVWGQFCLCHEGQKLLNDDDYVGMFGIKNGDQLQFIHHSSSGYNLVTTRAEREDFDSDDEPSISNRHRNEQQNGEEDDSHHIEIAEDKQDDDVDSDDGVVPRCEQTVTHLIRGWFPYRKLSNSYNGRSTPSRLSCNIMGSFKHVLWYSSNRHDPWKETGKGE